ncbi:hypothetical protein Bca52824_096293 [Brassica carinata]|uniref:Uncharacterized protein n=1 Tax=Brassica carinata TaxID=52824 RepID=A0A8X7P0J9_BRACI|nr:hypothetical protein Bca52824_096293 [Brassica carinata]
MILRFTLAAKESDYFVVSKQLELEISFTLAAKESLSVFGFNKGKAETVERYRLFFACPTNTGYPKLNGIRQPAKQIPLLPKSKLLEEIIKAKGKFDFTAELEKLKEELMEADGMLADVKVKVLIGVSLMKSGCWMSNLIL